MGQKAFLGCLLLVSALFLRSAVAKEVELEAHVDTSVTLPCTVNRERCGTLHSVKWYRDTSRVYVLSYAGHISRGEGDAVSSSPGPAWDEQRMVVAYDGAENETSLTINPVYMSDESTYKCEITYLEVRENCDVVQIVKLTTVAKPDAVHILGYDGEEVQNNQKLEPKDEGEEVSLTCTATGKPIPTISWLYNKTQLMNRASYTTKPGNFTGFGTGISKLQLILSRSDLNAPYECRVESQALNRTTMSSTVTIDVRVPPTSISLEGADEPIQQRDQVSLTCTVSGARPEARVWWTNSTILTNDRRRNVSIETISQENADGTITTISTLTFHATRWENGRYFKCYAQNEVLERKDNSTLHKTKILDVQFAPVITVNASTTSLIETQEKNEEVTLICTYVANPQTLEEAIWLKDGKELERIENKHFRGNKEDPSLHIKKIWRHDMGEYVCRLKNKVGVEFSESVFLDVLYPPDVKVVMEPSTPVLAIDQSNVTLVCNATDGNPTWLRKVRWFLDGELMADLPECNYSLPTAANETAGGPFCGIDPSILSLIKVDKTFAGNYTCQGQNDAGRYGPVSDPTKLEVYYPPSEAKLRYFPKTVIKNGEVTLMCEVEDLGWPNNNVTYIWNRGGYFLRETFTSNLTIPQASLETRSSFTCVAKNAGGKSNTAETKIDVLAPPAFIGNLNSYKGVLYTASNVSLTCRIECYPPCSITWFKDGHQLDTENNRLYYVHNTNHPADFNKNDFESVESTLVWNMANWPDQKLNKSAPHSHYTCAGISNGTQRPNVTFTTEIAIDFPPEDLRVSKSSVDVVENEIPHSVKCSGKGRPKLNYVWKRNSTGELIDKDDTLQLDKMPRSSAGYYTCEAYNKYGNKTVNAFFNVLYKPKCSIATGERGGHQVLICSAEANPKDVSYVWKVKESNETVDYKDEVFFEDGVSYLILDPSVENERIYICITNNSVGFSDPCHKEILGNIRLWYLDTHNLIVLVASIVTLIICVIIVCIIVIVMCRKKRQNAKSPNPSSTGDKMRLGAAPPVGGSADPANDHDKGFYENLPFHGMQNPPNKTNGTTTAGSDTYIF